MSPRRLAAVALAKAGLPAVALAKAGLPAVALAKAGSGAERSAYERLSTYRPLNAGGDAAARRLYRPAAFALQFCIVPLSLPRRILAVAGEQNICTAISNGSQAAK